MVYGLLTVLSMWMAASSRRGCDVTGLRQTPGSALDVVRPVDAGRWFTTTRIRNVLVATVIVLAGVAAADWYVRNAELRRLMTAAEAAAEAIDEWEAGRHRIMADLPGAFYLTPEQRRDTERQLRREAGEAMMSLTDAAARVHDVGIALPWHGQVERARDHHIDYIEAWIAHLQRVARDPSTLSEPTPTIATTRSASERAFRHALPPAALHGLDDRVEALFDGPTAAE